MIDIEKVKNEIVAKLKPIEPNKIILFGSYAYGTPNQDSDLDICIIKNNYKSKMKEKQKIRELLKEIRISKDILVVDEAYFETHSNENWINTALYEAKQKGEVLYEKK